MVSIPCSKYLLDRPPAAPVLPQMNDIFDTALAIKNRIYGNRVVLFAPLYIGERGGALGREGRDLVGRGHVVSDWGGEGGKA